MKKSMCAKWFEIKLWKKLIILFPITFIIIFVTLFETTPVNLNASNISEIYIGMHSMMTDIMAQLSRQKFDVFIMN